eukprot:5180987-Heterocapsa_arctica.AAC.1
MSLRGLPFLLMCGVSVLSLSVTPLAQDAMALYQVLGIGPHALKDEVRAAYKRQALAVHPDRGGCKEAFHA